MQMYLVGGAVRDKFLGKSPRDIDFTVELDEQDRWINDSAFYNRPFMCMVLGLERRGFKLVVETPEFFTARGSFPKRMAGEWEQHAGKFADFVLARKESDYIDGRRPGKVEIGTLYDDLSRRDFTMNAMAMGSDGTLHDPFRGTDDLINGYIRAVGVPAVRIAEDKLRALRAIRFAITMNFDIEPELHEVVKSTDLVGVSEERVMDELNKMLAFDTRSTIARLEMDFPGLADRIFSGSISLEATMKKRK